MLLSTLFIVTGVEAVAAPPVFAQGLGQMGVPYPALAAAIAIAINLVAPPVLILDFRGFGWFAALVLALFTAATIPYGHPFWLFDEPRRSMAFHIAAEHVSLIGGLLFVAAAMRRRAARPAA
jgi:transmembrane protein